MHLRRILLLIAIVLGLAAVAAALSPEPDEPAEEAPAPTLRDPRPAQSAKRASVRLDVRGQRPPARRAVPAGVPLTVTVAVDAPGEVSVPRLGPLAFAEPGAPATLDLLLLEPGRYEVRFDPLEGEPRTIATLAAGDER